MSGVPVRNTDDAVCGTWAEKIVRVHQENDTCKQTFYTTFFTSLTIKRGNVKEIARCGRARWKIDNECFNCIARHRRNFKHYFGHGKNGLANTLAAVNLLVFALHTVLDRVEGLWKQCQEYHKTRRDFFEELQILTRKYCSPDWCSLWESMLDRHPPVQPAVARA